MNFVMCLCLFLAGEKPGLGYIDKPWLLLGLCLSMFLWSSGFSFLRYKQRWLLCVAFRRMVRACVRVHGTDPASIHPRFHFSVLLFFIVTCHASQCLGVRRWNDRMFQLDLYINLVQNL